MSVCTDAMALIVPNTVLQGGGEDKGREEKDSDGECLSRSPSRRPITHDITEVM